MAAIVYPSSLPGPTFGPLTAAERRLTSLGPFEGRAFQRDRLEDQPVTLIFSALDLAIFEGWYRATLDFGGAWFAAAWPYPQTSDGWATVVRKWKGALRREALGAGCWQITGVCECRGRGLAPTAPKAVFLATFNDGTVSDVAPNPASYVVGPDVTIAGGSYVMAPTPTAFANQVAWTGAKFDALLGIDFQVVTKIVINTISSSTGRPVFRLSDAAETFQCALVMFGGTPKRYRFLGAGGDNWSADEALVGGTVICSFGGSGLVVSVNGLPVHWCSENGAGTVVGTEHATTLPFSTFGSGIRPSIGGGGYQGAEDIRIDSIGIYT